MSAAGVVALAAWEPGRWRRFEWTIFLLVFAVSAHLWPMGRWWHWLDLRRQERALLDTPAALGGAVPPPQSDRDPGDAARTQTGLERQPQDRAVALQDLLLKLVSAARASGVDLEWLRPQDEQSRAGLDELSVAVRLLGSYRNLAACLAEIGRSAGLFTVASLWLSAQPAERLAQPWAKGGRAGLAMEVTLRASREPLRAAIALDPPPTMVADPFDPAAPLRTAAGVPRPTIDGSSPAQPAESAVDSFLGALEDADRKLALLVVDGALRAVAVGEPVFPRGPVVKQISETAVHLGSLDDQGREPFAWVVPIGARQAQR